MDTGADRSEMRDRQSARLRQLLADVAKTNRFYSSKYSTAGISRNDLLARVDLHQLPFTTKAELAADQAANPPYGSALSYPTARYCRLHQTSGTSTGSPLRWLDCPESWTWILNCWRTCFAMMGLTPSDRVFFPFSFGPFLGFWSAFEASSQFGCLTIPGGGMSSTARLRFLIEHRFSVLFATPTYALHLAEVAEKERIDLFRSTVRAVVVAGEPGGNIPATRQRIEAAWGARVFDHYGLTELGPVAMECEADPTSMVVLESDYIAEILQPGGSQPTSPGEVGELVITNLGRTGCPLIRYRTGDLVTVDPNPSQIEGVPGWIRLKGGILGRVDDMIHVRGNNLYPTSIEAIIRRFPEVVEFRLIIDESGSLPDLRIEIEPSEAAAGRRIEAEVSQAIRDNLLFRVEVKAVAPGSLPRYEMKARRLVRMSTFDHK